MEIREIKISDLREYENNPRNNDNAVEAVAASIKQFGWKVPLVVDKDGVIVAGHTRLKAAKRLGMQTVPCIVADDLTEEQVRAFRLADNKTAELAEWDLAKLAEEIGKITDIDMALFGFCEDEEGGEDATYTTKVDIPQYEIEGKAPDLSELVDTEKTDALVSDIEAAKIPKDIKEFLKLAAQRHLTFNYAKIAEYYAAADKDVQELFERSALVIIDFDNAIANGYVKLSKTIEQLIEDSKHDAG